MTLRALPQEMEPAGNGLKRANWLHYGAQHPPEAMDAQNYFQPCANRLAKQDRILAMAEAADGSWCEATFVVLHSERKTVIVRRITDWISFDIGVVGPVTLMPRGTERFDVVDASGRTIKADADGMTARALARAYQAPGDPSPAATESMIRRSGTQPLDPDSLTTIPELQSAMKLVTGAGFKVGTSIEDMRAGLKAALAEKAAA